MRVRKFSLNPRGLARHFRPAPGRYVAFLQATDLFNNVSRIRRVPFTILAPPRRHRRRT